MTSLFRQRGCSLTNIEGLRAVSAIQRQRNLLAGVLDIYELRPGSREPAQPRTGRKATVRCFFVFLWLVISVSGASFAAQIPPDQGVDNPRDTQEASPPEPGLVPEPPSIQPCRFLRRSHSLTRRRHF